VEAVVHRLSYRSPDIFKLYPLGDIHAGTIYCNEAKIKAQVDDIAKDPLALWVGIGDYADLVLEKDWRHESPIIAPWVVQQHIPASQCDWVTSLFKPVKDKCIGLIEGNHEAEVRKNFSFDFVRQLSENLGVRHLGAACGMRLIFERDKSKEHHEYKCWFMHGAGAPQTEGGRMMNLMAALAGFHGDIYAKGHIHCLSTATIPYLTLGETDPPHLINRQKVGAITGCWFETYKEGCAPSYGEKKCYRPSAMGCPVFFIEPQRSLVSVFDNSTRMAARLGKV